MKKSYVSIASMMLFVIFTLSSFNVKEVGAKISWVSDTFNLGKVNLGSTSKAEFQFTNNGDEPVIITSVKASCGCTVTDYPREAILPGSNASIYASYKASSTGVFSKTVTVTTSASAQPVLLRLKGEVIQ
jgi:hypothetical protein